ncbi:MAG: PilX N-terminal domain-containing pilus assembly protein [Porticoccaceae bacterium]
MVALIFLLLLSILAVSIMRSGQLEVLMAGNSQAQLSAFEFAEGVSESILARRSSNLNSNAVICGTCTSSSTTCSASFSPTPSDPAFTCSISTLALDDRFKPAYTGTGALVAIKNGTIQGRVRPLNEGKPSCVPSFVPRVYGLANAYAIFFDVEASYDNSVSRQGASRVNQGVVWVIPGELPNCAAPHGKLDDIAHTVTGPTGI